MKARRKKIKRLDDRNLRAKGITVCSRAADSLASAMKNILQEKHDVAMEYLIDVFDYLMEVKVIDNETWKRYKRTKKDNRKKADIIYHLKKSPPVLEEHCRAGMEFILDIEGK